MFLSSYEKLREFLIECKTLISLAHLGARAFSQISGEVVQTCAWIIGNNKVKDYSPIYYRLVELSEDEKRNSLLSGKNSFL
ncbi:type II restriction endonuclease subunit M, partial [Streptococcus suis]